MTQKKVRKTIEIVGEITRVGTDYPIPSVHENDDGTKAKVIYLDVRATESRDGGNIYKVQIRGERALEAFSSKEFEHIPEQCWYRFNAPNVGDWVRITGSYSVKEPTKDFDRKQNMLTVWEPWHIKSHKSVPRPAKKKMQTY